MDPESMKPFDEQFKAWARRPPSTSAAAASRQVLRRLAGQEEPRRRQVRRWGAGVAVAAFGGVLAAGFLAVVNLSLVDDPKGPGSVLKDPTAVVSHLESAPVPEGVAVIWLDPTTPLYLTVDAPDAPEGGSAP